MIRQICKNYRCAIKHGQQFSRCASTNANSEEEKFRRFQNHWWNKNGPLKALHAMNDIRVPLVAEAAGKERISGLPLTGVDICDVGCGGGILSEALARRGGKVVGIDMVGESVDVAAEHAAVQQDLPIQPEYICSTMEEFSDENEEKFDVLIASEVIEHVENLDDFIFSAARVLKPGGALIISTINRTNASYLATIVAAEYFLGIVPKGTHDWEKFIKPEELEDVLEQNNCVIRKELGMFYNPLENVWCWISSKENNYAIVAYKN